MFFDFDASPMTQVLQLAMQSRCCCVSNEEASLLDAVASASALPGTKPVGAFTKTTASRSKTYLSSYNVQLQDVSGDMTPSCPVLNAAQQLA
jgi:hypothetical protein